MGNYILIADSLLHLQMYNQILIAGSLLHRLQKIMWQRNQKPSYNPRKRNPIRVPGAVYGYCCPNLDSLSGAKKFIKIGRSGHVLRRLDQWQVDDGHDLGLLFVVSSKNQTHLQHLIHQYLKVDRIWERQIYNPKSKRYNTRIQWFQTQTPLHHLPLIAALLEEWRSELPEVQCINRVRKFINGLNNFRSVSEQIEEKNREISHKNQQLRDMIEKYRQVQQKLNQSSATTKNLQNPKNPQIQSNKTIEKSQFLELNPERLLLKNANDRLTSELTELRQKYSKLSQSYQKFKANDEELCISFRKVEESFKQISPQRRKNMKFEQIADILNFNIIPTELGERSFVPYVHKIYKMLVSENEDVHQALQKAEEKIFQAQAQMTRLQKVVLSA